MGARVSEFDETDMEMEDTPECSDVDDDESLGVNEMGVVEDDSDIMEESSVQDNAALNESL